MTAKVLFVDDEERVVTSLRIALEDDYEIHIAGSGKTGLEKIKESGPFAVVVSDLKMPVMDGIEFLQKVHDQAPLSVRVVLTGYADVKSAIDLVNKGQIFRFLTKPCVSEEVKAVIEAAVEQHRLLTLEKDMLNRTVRGMVEVLTEIMSLLDPVEFSQVPQKKDLVIELCANLGVKDPLNVVLATMLSSIGSATLPAPMLLKIRMSEKLSDIDSDLLDKVCHVGANLLQKIPRLEKVAHIVRHQRYKNSDAGKTELPQGAKILKVVNDFVRMKTNGMSEGEALATLQKSASQYDREVMNVLQTKIREKGGKKDQSKESRPITAANLALGQILARDVMTVDGVLIAPARTIVGESVLTKLENYAKLIGLAEPLYVYGAEA